MPRSPHSSGRPLLALLLLLLVPARAPAQVHGPAGAARAPAARAGGEERRSQVAFFVEETLSLPARSRVTLGLVPAEPCQIQATWGPAGSPIVFASPIRTVAPGQRASFVLANLAPGLRYVYRVRTRGGPDEPWAWREERSFRGLAEVGSTFRFAFATDGHAWQQWANADCGRAPSVGLANLQLTLENALASDVDFLVTCGDEVQTHCITCAGCAVDGEDAGAGTVLDARQAELRWRALLSPELYGRLTPSVPIVWVLGNHDGETGFGDLAGTCGHHLETRAHSQAGRLAMLPNPTGAWPGGNPEGSYYAFEAGDCLFVVLDVFRYVPDYPLSAEDWTLGWQQRTWLLSTLANSPRRWKVVLAHHLVGGSPDLSTNTCYYYGRGGIRSTEDGTTRGPFLGEQQDVQDLMAAFGAQLFLYGHDHVAICGQKRTAGGGNSGVHYVQGGQSGGAVPPWLGDHAFEQQMDWNEDGQADFYEGPPTPATYERGFFLATVQGTARITLDFVVTDAEDAARNGTVLFRYVVQ